LITHNTSQNERWLDLAAWDDCADAVDVEKLAGCGCYAGLDLASTTDIAALVLVFPHADGFFDVLPFFWVPAENMRERMLRDRVPYEAWARQGFIIPTQGNVIDFKAIEKKIKEVEQQFYLHEVAFDRWGAVQITQNLEAEGIKVVPEGQGFATMSGPTKDLLTLVLSKKIRHGGNPVLRWMCDNASIRQDPAGNIKLDKSRSRERIDGLVALVMALDRAMRDKSSSVFDDPGTSFV
jgi:phage terminase large subunit-like protein